jgi:hypothetical protein
MNQEEVEEILKAFIENNVYLMTSNSLKSILDKQHYDLQIVATAMILKVDSGFKDELKVDAMVERIISYLYGKYSCREISNAILNVKDSLDVLLKKASLLNKNEPRRS